MSSLLEQASLIMIPSGYKEDVVYSEVPTNGNGDLSFTRASNGTRVNSSGLVEVCPWNLVSYSEEFTNANWSGFAGVVANSTTAPNGTLTADTNNGAGIYPASGLGDATMSNTSSIYAKANPSGSSTLTLRVNSFGSGTDYLEVTFNLSTGIAGAVTNSGTASGGVASMESVGNGWYRCILSGTSSTTASVLSFNPQNDCFIWGAQLNIGATAKPYFPTTDRLNVPRLTYQNGGGGCPSLLLEKQSTNLFTYSEDFSNVDWLNEDITVSTNQTISPDGTQNADKLIANTTTLDHSIYQTSSGSTKTFSVYAKAGEYNYIFLGSNNNSASDGAFFNLSNGTISQNTSGLTASIESVGNGWYRCIVSSTSWPTIYCIICLSANGTSLTLTGNNTSGIYAWGAQLEASSYPTSYIPTTSASATRVADACFKTGISSLIGQTEGVAFVDFDFNGNYSSGGIITICLDGGAGNELYIWVQTSGLLLCEVANSGSVQASITGAVGSIGRKKIAFAYKQNDFVVYLNGTQVGTDTSGTVPIMSRLYVGKYWANDTYNLTAGVNQAILFPTRLTNAELASLTTI